MAKKTKSLEELNRLYTKEIEARKVIDTNRKIRNKNKRKVEVEVKKRMIAVSMIAVVLLIILLIMSQQNGEVSDIVPTILTEEEREKWKSMEAEEGKVYIELNSKIEVDDKNANIRLVNPIYNAYTISIQVWEKKDKDNLLYESEKLKPGTILETIKLSKALSAKEYKGIVNYIIYDEDGNQKSTYPIDVRLINKNTGTN